MSRLAALRPSFFEAYAATHLSATLRPALRFTLEVLSIRRPRLAPLAARADELLSAALLLLEGAQLRATSATLAEGFYALRRSPAPLGARRIAAALVFVVVLPYLRRRADRAHEEATGGAAAELLGSRVRADGVRELVASGEWRSVFRRWYPAVTAGLDGAELICNLLYLFGHTDYFSPALVLQRSVLRKVSPEEFVRMQERAAREAGFKPASLSDLMCAGAGKLLTIAKYAFFASIFAFRFVEYYHAAEVRAAVQFILLSSLVMYAFSHVWPYYRSSSHFLSLFLNRTRLPASKPPFPHPLSLCSLRPASIARAQPRDTPVRYAINRA